MSLLIQKAGILDTIQDDGRYGFQQLGINPGGTMDRIAMRVVNMLVGNDAKEAVLEMHYPSSAIVFEEDSLVAVSGADFSVTINGRELPLNQPAFVQKNSVLQTGKRNKGARLYLAIAGGVQSAEWLGSNSTDSLVGSGGFEGRALQKGDRIFLQKKIKHSFPETALQLLPWQANTRDLYRNAVIRFTVGRDWHELSDHSKIHFTSEQQCISASSNRMGYRLEGPVLERTDQDEKISSAVTRGAIQLLPSGQLIILMADHQTTGGYPVMGHIISADFPSLAQFSPGENFLLQPVTMAEAEYTFARQQLDLQQLQNACNFRLQQYR